MLYYYSLGVYLFIARFNLFILMEEEYGTKILWNRLEYSKWGE